MKKIKSIKLFKTIKSQLIGVSLILIALGIILPILITSRILLKNIQLEKEAETISSFTHTATKINKTVSSAITSAMLLKDDYDVYHYLTKGYLNKDNVKKTLDKIAFINAIKDTFYINEDLNAVLFFNEDKMMFGASTTWNFFIEDNQHPFLYSQAYSKFKKSGNNSAYLGTFLKTEFTRGLSSKKRSSEDYMISNLHKINYTLESAKQMEIIMLISIKEASLRKTFEYIHDGDGIVYLLDSEGNQISGSDLSFMGEKPGFFKQLNSELQYGSINYKLNKGDGYQVVYYHLDDLDWTLVKQIPTNIYYKSTNLLLRTALITGFIFILITSLLYTIFVIRFTRPLNEVIKALAQVRDGKFTTHIPETSEIKEFVIMQQQFNLMIESVNALLIQKEKDEKEKLMLEVRNLQAQIDPHFIYNSIGSIRWMATLSGAEKISDMLVVLINLLRPVFSEWELEWTLEEELTFAKNYMKLMMLRYGNRISLEIKNEIDLFDINVIKIPRFTLQPLLENSCEHGIIPDHELFIKINISYDSEKLLINVIDNGIGIPPEKVKRLNRNFTDHFPNQNIENKKVKSGGIGLMNINRRLKLHYGNEYGLTIIDKQDGITCIEVRIKIDNKVDHNKSTS